MLFAFVNVTILQVTVLRKKKTFSEKDMAPLIWHEQRSTGLILSIYCQQNIYSFQTSDKFVGDDIKMGFKEKRWEDLDCVFLTCDMDSLRALTNTVM